jgi:hypothetical protein
VEEVGFQEMSERIVRASPPVAPVRCRLAPAQVVARLRIVRASVRVARARSRPARVRVDQSAIDRVRAVVIDPVWATSRAIALPRGRVSATGLALVAIGRDDPATDRAWAIGLDDLATGL